MSSFFAGCFDHGEILVANPVFWAALLLAVSSIAVACRILYSFFAGRVKPISEEKCGDTVAHRLLAVEMAKKKVDICIMKKRNDLHRDLENKYIHGKPRMRPSLVASLVACLAVFLAACVCLWSVAMDTSLVPMEMEMENDENVIFDPVDDHYLIPMDTSLMLMEMDNYVNGSFFPVGDTARALAMQFLHRTFSVNGSIISVRVKDLQAFYRFLAQDHLKAKLLAQLGQVRGTISEIEFVSGSEWDQDKDLFLVKSVETVVEERIRLLPANATNCSSSRNSTNTTSGGGPTHNHSYHYTMEFEKPKADWKPLMVPLLMGVSTIALVAVSMFSGA